MTFPSRTIQVSRIHSLFIILPLLLSACTPKLSPTLQKEFSKIHTEIKNIKAQRFMYDIAPKYPDFNFQVTILPVSKAHTKLEKAALKLEPDDITPIIVNSSDNCGFIKIINKGRDSLMRVNTIMLEDKSEEGILAKKILAEYNNGTSFSVLAQQYGKEKTIEKDGDYGWIINKRMVPKFVRACAKINDANQGKLFCGLTR